MTSSYYVNERRPSLHPWGGKFVVDFLLLSAEDSNVEPVMLTLD